MSQMLIQHKHLATANACTNVAHAIVIAYLLVKIVRHGFTRLSGIEHGFLLGCIIGANQGAAAAGGNHLVTIKAHDAKIAERAAQSATITRAECLGRILNDRNLVTVSNLHDVINHGRHTIEIHGNHGLRFATRFSNTVFDSLLEQVGVHVPGTRLTIYKHWRSALIYNWIGTCRERH